MFAVTSFFLLFGVPQIVAFLPPSGFTPNLGLSLPSAGSESDVPSSPGSTFGAPPANVPNPITSFNNVGNIDDSDSNAGGDDGGDGGDGGVGGVGGTGPLPSMPTLTLNRPSTGKTEEKAALIDFSEQRFTLLNETLSKLEQDVAPITPCDCVASISDKETFDGLKTRFTGFQSSCGADPSLSSLQNSFNQLLESGESLDQTSVNLPYAQEQLQVAQSQLAEVNANMEQQSDQGGSDQNPEEFVDLIATIKSSYDDVAGDSATCLSNCNSGSDENTQAVFAEVTAQYEGIAAEINDIDVAELEIDIANLEAQVSTLQGDVATQQDILDSTAENLETHKLTKTDLADRLSELDVGYSQKAKVADADDISNDLETLRSAVSSKTIDDPSLELASVLSEVETQSGIAETDILLLDVQTQYTLMTALDNVDTSQIGAGPSRADELATAVAEIESHDSESIEAQVHDARDQVTEVLNSLNDIMNIIQGITDDTTGYDISKCPYMFIPLESVNMCISIIMENLNWFEALSACKHQAGDTARLVVIDTEEKRQAVYNEVMWYGSSNYHIGLHTFEPNVWPTQYTWVDRWEQFDTWNGMWNWGQPDRSYSTGCGNLWNGLLDDIDCFGTYIWAICELPKAI